MGTAPDGNPCMDEAVIEARLRKLAVSLRVMAVTVLLLGIALLVGVFAFLPGETLIAVSEELMVGSGFLMAVIGCVVFLVILSGILSLLRIQWGWFVHIISATLLIILALLTEPRSLFVIKASFFTLLSIAILLWATALVNYYYDLYR